MRGENEFKTARKKLLQRLREGKLNIIDHDNIREKCDEETAELMEKVRPQLDPETIVSEPAPAPIERVKGKYRFMATFRYGKLAPLRRALRREIYSVRRPDVEIYVDVDPISML